MNCYDYQAVNSLGVYSKGILYANNEREVAIQLLEQGLNIIKIRVKNNQVSLKNIWRADEKKELLIFCNQLSVMLAAGINLGECLRIMLKDSSNQSLQQKLSSLYKGLCSGASFSDLLENHSDFFPRHFVAAVRVGEKIGLLHTVIEKEREIILKDYKSKEKLKTIMLYPLFLLVVASCMIVFILTFILPAFSEMFVALNTDLPLITKIIMGCVAIFNKYWFILPILLILMFSIFNRLWQINSFKLYMYSIILKIPVLGRVEYLINIQKWLHTLSLLIKGGMLITEAIKISVDVIENLYIRESVAIISDRIKKGESFYTASSSCQFMQGIIRELILAGEISGELDRMLIEAGNLCEIEAGELIERLENMLEPTIIVLIGGIVGIIVIGVMLPVLEMITIYS